VDSKCVCVSKIGVLNGRSSVVVPSKGVAEPDVL